MKLSDETLKAICNDLQLTDEDVEIFMKIMQTNQESIIQAMKSLISTARAIHDFNPAIIKAIFE